VIVGTLAGRRHFPAVYYKINMAWTWGFGV
jgi:hypothetical protein